MFESTYGLSAAPFQLNPDPAFYFGSRGHDSAHQYLRFGVYQGEGFIVITGDIGTGKTTLVRTMLAELDSNRVVAAQLVSTQLEANDLLRAVTMAFGVPAKGATKAEVLGSLEAYFTAQAIEGRRALLVIDEAQNLPLAAVEELRMLSNFQFGNRTLLQSFLVGQPELRNIMRLPAMEQLRQRVIASCHLGPMGADETRGYVEHRLKCVDWHDDPHFEDAAFDAIHRWTGGVPRRINMLCNRLLLSSFLAGSHDITRANVESVAREIRAEIGGTHALESVTETPPTITEPTREVRRARLGGSGVGHADGAEVGRKGVIRAVEVSPGVWQNRAVVPLPKDPGPILCVCASRQNLLSMGPLVGALEHQQGLPDVLLVHVDSTPDEAIDDPVYERLEVPVPHFTLVMQVGSESQQTAELMKSFESIVDVYTPSSVLVVGDGHPILACSLVACSKEISLVHVDAGVRTFDRTSTWEVNRVVIDQIADVHFTAERAAHANLTQEGIRPEQIYFVGHLLSDTLLAAAPQAVDPALTLQEAGVEEGSLPEGTTFGLVGLNCPPDIHNRREFEDIVSMLRKFSKIVPLVWPINQQTQASFERHGLTQELRRARLVCVPPLGYLKLLGLMKAATCVVTDSRSMQDEASTFGVPCLTLRPDADRRVTVELGSNSVVGSSLKRMMGELSEILDTGGKRGQVPELWDGHVAERIAEQISRLQLTRGRVVSVPVPAPAPVRGSSARAK